MTERRAEFVFVMAFTGPHADEALNVLLSLRRAGAFRTDVGAPFAAASLPASAVLIYTALGGSYAGRRTALEAVSPTVRLLPLAIPSVHVASKQADYGTGGFSRIVQAKFIALEDAARRHPGAHIVWLDTDLYFFRDPRPPLLDHAARAAGKHAHFQQSARSACTGFFLITPGQRAQGMQLLRRAKAMLEDHLAKGPGAGYLDDETCVNRVVAMHNVPVSYLPRDLFPNGRDYFDLGMRARAVMVHNNFIRGLDKKVARFKKHSLWLVGAAIALRPSGSGNPADAVALRARHPSKGAPRKALFLRKAPSFPVRPQVLRAMMRTALLHRGIFRPSPRPRFVRPR